ncbi:MAG: hypothetical protein ACRD4Q_08130 [Candidatus Acidiferrales bacterium]
MKNLWRSVAAITRLKVPDLRLPKAAITVSVQQSQVSAKRESTLERS